MHWTFVWVDYGANGLTIKRFLDLLGVFWNCSWSGLGLRNYQKFLFGQIVWKISCKSKIVFTKEDTRLQIDSFGNWSVKSREHFIVVYHWRGSGEDFRGWVYRPIHSRVFNTYDSNLHFILLMLEHKSFDNPMFACDCGRCCTRLRRYTEYDCWTNKWRSYFIWRFYTSEWVVCQLDDYSELDRRKCFG